MKKAIPQITNQTLITTKESNQVTEEQRAISNCKYYLKKTKPKWEASKFVRNSLRESERLQNEYLIQCANMSNPQQQMADGALLATFCQAHQEFLASMEAAVNRGLEANEQMVSHLSEVEESFLEDNRSIATAEMEQATMRFKCVIKSVLSPLVARSTNISQSTNNVSDNDPPPPHIVMTCPAAVVVDDVSVLNVDGSADGLASMVNNNNNNNNNNNYNNTNNNNNSNNGDTAPASSTATAGFLSMPSTSLNNNNNNNIRNTTVRRKPRPPPRWPLLASSGHRRCLLLSPTTTTIIVMMVRRKPRRRR
jgi:hypothetical protein